MKEFFSVLIVCLFSGLASADAVKPEVIKNVQSNTVTVHSGEETEVGFCQGTGVLFTRDIKVGDKTQKVTFVWTAAHVVQNQVTKPKYKTITGEEIEVKIDNLFVTQEVLENNNKVGLLRFDAKLIAIGSPGQDDIALLMVDKHDSFNTSAIFDKTILPMGTEIFYFGSFFGAELANSFNVGVVSFVNRVIPTEHGPAKFDQICLGCVKGASGGGIYTYDGKCAGIVVRVAAGFISYCVPTRFILDWAEEKKVSWAVDASVEMPPLDELVMKGVDGAKDE